MALTATATDRVRTDVMAKLRIPNGEIFVQSFNRPNLYYSVILKKKNTVNDQIATFIQKNCRGSCGIVYCFSKRDCETVSQALQSKGNLLLTLGITADFYHGDLTGDVRTQKYDAWINDQVQVMVATIAFGMGINKPDVRFVIHHTMSQSLEAYYQESGRAGRDGEPAHCVLLYNYQDKFRIEQLLRRSDQENRRNSNYNPQSLRTNMENLHRIVGYCQNTFECRRAQQMEYFGEKFAAHSCRKTCDNCQRSEGYSDEDVTSECKIVLGLLKHIGEITIPNLSLVYRGSQAKSLQDDWKSHPLAGKGSNPCANLRKFEAK